MLISLFLSLSLRQPFPSLPLPTCYARVVHNLAQFCVPLTVLFGDGALQPQEALVEVHLDVALPHEAEHEVVREAGMTRVHLQTVVFMLNEELK